MVLLLCLFCCIFSFVVCYCRYFVVVCVEVGVCRYACVCCLGTHSAYALYMCCVCCVFYQQYSNINIIDRLTLLKSFSVAQHCCPNGWMTSAQYHDRGYTPEWCEKSCYNYDDCSNPNPVCTTGGDQICVCKGN